MDYGDTQPQPGFPPVRAAVPTVHVSYTFNATCMDESCLPLARQPEDFRVRNADLPIPRSKLLVDTPAARRLGQRRSRSSARASLAAAASWKELQRAGFKMSI